MLRKIYLWYLKVVLVCNGRDGIGGMGVGGGHGGGEPGATVDDAVCTVRWSRCAPPGLAWCSLEVYVSVCVDVDVERQSRNERWTR